MGFFNSPKVENIEDWKYPFSTKLFINEPYKTTRLSKLTMFSDVQKQNMNNFGKILIIATMKTKCRVKLLIRTHLL